MKWLCFLLALPLGAAPAWTSLFDGRSLKGWQGCGGTAFRVEKGVLVGAAGAALCSGKRYGDFVLEMEVMGEGEVAVRGAGTMDEMRSGQWNKYRVEARGARIVTSVNGGAGTERWAWGEFDSVLTLRGAGRWRNVRIQDEGRSGWMALGDGKSLEGWIKNGGGEWTVTGGVLEGKSNPAEMKRGLLIWNEEWTDFTVRVEYKTVKGNSGVFFRMGDPDNGTDVNKLGFEVEVDPTRDAGGLQEPGRGARGWMQRTGPAEKIPNFRPGEFNTLVIHAHGGRIVTFVNGVKMAESVDDPGRKRGRLALQLNPRQDLEVYYRNVALLGPARD